MEKFIEITFKNIPSWQQEILIARLIDFGFEAFEERPDQLIACIKPEIFNEEEFDEQLKGEYELSKNLIEQRNWNEEWERSFQPVIVEDFCAVRASFHEPVLGTKYEVIITPKMSFGTGHHATTYQMIQWMRNLNFENTRVMDFGTGTGILAILAEKMNAAEIVAIDSDEWSIQNAEENLQLNDCKRILLKQADFPDAQGDFDIILANINKHVILTHFDAMKTRLKNSGILLVSGLLTDDEDDIIKAGSAIGLELSGRSQKDNWLALKLQPKHI
jgi:ribosomal protein L11 methyltransferase